MSRPALVISLDFELFWGVRDHRELDAYRQNIEGVHRAVPRMLALFEEQGVHATWAVVGLLGMEDADDACAHAPAVLPGYTDRNLCPFEYLRAAGPRERAAHFAPEIVEQIHRTPGQELATHTFSHFYCLEAPQSLVAFRADLEAAKAVARARVGAELTSLVFPRNQYSPAHIEIAGELGITAYRGNPPGWMHSPRPHGDDTLARRGARLADTFLPVSRDHSFPASRLGAKAPYNVAASRFLRPWTATMAWADRLRIGRIERELEVAARRGRVYHLWWHPHNFGRDLEQNLAGLTRILGAFRRFRDRREMASLTMREVASVAETAAA